MGLLLPPGLRDSTREYEAEVLSMVDRFRSVMDWFNRELREIDVNLELIFAPPTVKVVGLMPGRWHIMRHMPGGPPTLIPYVGPNDEYLDPDSGIFEMLRRSDMWDERAAGDQRRRVEASAAAASRQKAREAEARREEIKERMAAATRVQVSMNRDVAWTQNHAGSRRRDRLRS